MTYNFTADSLDELYWYTLDELLSSPDFRPSPRGTKVHELIGAQLTLTNPRNRLVLAPDRATNYGFGVGELCWYLRGDNDLKTLLYYNKRAANYSDDGETVNSAYGKLLFESLWARGVSQWDICKLELITDTDSRRAVMHINQPVHMYMTTRTGGTKDVPCTMSLQFMIRNRKLHLHVLMRSNDIMWGTPYDVFSFTVMQEAMMLQLQELGAPVDDLGEYHHTCGSLHLYDYHFDVARKIVDASMTKTRPMERFTLARLRDLAEVHEPDIRLNACDQLPNNEPEPDGVDWMLFQLFKHQRKRREQEKR